MTKTKNEVAQFVLGAYNGGENLSHEVKVGNNIIIPQTSEEEWYYVKYNNVWYSVKWDWDEFRDGIYDNVEVEEDFVGEEYYNDMFC